MISNDVKNINNSAGTYKGYLCGGCNVFLVTILPFYQKPEDVSKKEIIYKASIQKDHVLDTQRDQDRRSNYKRLTTFTLHG